MRDSVNLSADVYLPETTGAFPTILLRNPYESSLDVHIEWAVWWARRGYAVAVQDCRGRFQSKGEFYAYMDDGRDGHDTLEWIANQPWSNGRIGMSGRSYGGLVQWQAAPHRSPHLTALAPQVIPGDYFSEIHRIGGAVQWALTIMSAITFVTNVSFMQRGCTHLFGNERFYRHLPLIDADIQAIGREIPHFRDWMEHELDDEYWHTINTHDRVEEIDVPIYQQGGWYDPYTEAMFRLHNGMRERGRSQRTRESQKIYIVPWTHHIPEGSRLGDLDFGPQAPVDLNLEDLRWFDYWLKGIDTGIMDEPPIRLFVMGRNTWRNEHEWPLERTEFTPWFLHSAGRANTLHGDGTLDPEPPGAEPADRYSYDPDNPVPTVGGNNSTWTLMKFAADQVVPGPLDQRVVERRDDVLVYTSAALERDVEVTGPVEVVLYAASSSTDTDFTAKLVDVWPDGRAIHIAEGIIRARHRNGFDGVEFLEPGEVQSYTIELASTSNVFLSGHRIRVEISSSNFPRFDRNLNTGGSIATGTEMETADQTVLHTADYPSHILLPIIPA
ncbi:MAG: CocE/NonD family hydrolase [Acidimicrobiia bacterium]|nr:CocE/NonD family hydrolase [Acidimicrobiia bacterium]